MMRTYADVIVDISISKLDKSFQYSVPDALRQSVTEGVKVRVPFGKADRLTDGYVISIGNEPKCDEKLIKPIESCPDNYITAEERLIRLAAWIRRTYGSTYIAALKTVLPVKEKRKRPAKAARNEIARQETKGIGTLNAAQQGVYNGICAELAGRRRPCLIEGVTGSGKTHIYMKLIQDTFSSGKSAILLIPEISLTWQTVSRFYACFGDVVAVLHSRLSKGERADLITDVKSGKVRLVIGPRSALFTPFDDLGLIIIDEEHDTSYQSEKTPRYHARETAVMRASIEGASLVLGSATPSLESRYRCDTGDYALFTLDDRFAGAAMPMVKITDMRRELSGGKRAVISNELRLEMEERLERREQVMLFLNKRGHTGFFTCRSCGYVFKCPHCDIALTYHTNGLLMCHYCGYAHPMTDSCPKCGSPYIGGFKAGTQQAEAAVKKLFPSARVMRMDADTTKNKHAHENLLSAFSSGEADILIGTQMIVKGHDFPNVTLVGILAADASLYASDFRSGERTFQLLVQACGRAGRGEKRGLALIQTCDPENFVIQAAAAADYEAFYAEELQNRRMMHYPPAGCFMAAHAEAKDDASLLNAMTHLKKYIESLNVPDAVVLGPAAEAVAKLRDNYRRVLYVKGAGTDAAIKIRQYAEKYVEINRGFDKINIQFALND